jgi:ferredoxin-NADP reductase
MDRGEPFKSGVIMTIRVADDEYIQPAGRVFMAKLQGRREVAYGTMAFDLEKPVGWSFEAGQFVDVTLLNPTETDSEGNTRHFSIASAPFENTLMIATRMRDSAFKRVLRTLPLGTEVKIEGPFGNLRLHNNAARPAVVLSGGIGITPFRSILLQAARDKRPQRIIFIYANRRPEDAPFLDELRGVARETPSFTFVPTMTEMDKSDIRWDGERGRIDQALLAKNLNGVTSAVYYVTGPPGMVHGLRTLLKASGVDDGDIRTEEFTGY